jgi:hypothetical protein
MNRTGTSHIFRFVGLIILQILLLRLNLHGFINPYVYPLFLLLLPFEIAPAILIFYGFVLGISVDMFTNTMGIHAAVSVFTAFLRPHVLNMLIPSGGYDSETAPRIKDMGFTWFIAYTGILVFLHHIVLFYLEIMRWSETFYILGKTLFSTIIALIIILVIEYFSFSRKTGRRYGN